MAGHSPQLLCAIPPSFSRGDGQPPAHLSRSLAFRDSCWESKRRGEKWKTLGESDVQFPPHSWDILVQAPNNIANQLAKGWSVRAGEALQSRCYGLGSIPKPAQTGSFALLSGTLGATLFRGSLWNSRNTLWQGFGQNCWRRSTRPSPPAASFWIGEPQHRQVPSFCNIEHPQKEAASSICFSNCSRSKFSDLW